MIIQSLLDLYKSCTLCPRACRVDRTKGELGYCRLPADIVMDCALAHHGEEPPLSGTRGAGTIFLSSCNLGCIYCQNYQISHSAQGRHLTVLQLAKVMLDLQKSGCHNVEPVTPTPQAPLVMEALCMARMQGLTVPFVYNCGGYENPDVFDCSTAWWIFICRTLNTVWKKILSIFPSAGISPFCTGFVKRNGEPGWRWSGDEKRCGSKRNNYSPFGFARQNRKL